jgi:large subunit ribosomal protein L21|tara:strand:- start:11994 stop:12308 length:315 start_codon:yes stop_codon:yes gene_type:complete
MEYAIIEIGGHQVWVEVGQYFITNRIATKVGTKIALNRVLLINKDGDVKFGSPYLENSNVQGEIIEHLRGSKLIVYKMKSKKKYRRKKGHRQQMTKLIINTIEV